MTPSQYCSVENGMFTGSAFRPLLWISGKDNINYSRSIASGITVSNNDKTYTVHLKSTYKWSNGQPVTAQDALFAYNMLLNAAKSNSPWGYCGTGIGGLGSIWGSASAPNSHTLVVNITKSSNPTWFEHNGLAQIVPLPSKTMDTHTNWVNELKHIMKVGTSRTLSGAVVDGPYTYGPFKNDQYSTLVANPKYTGPVKAKVKKLTFLYETSSANQWAQMLKGVYATANVPNSYYAERNQLKPKGYNLTLAPYSFCFNYMVPNMWPNSPVGTLFQKTYIRQALQDGIDQAGMISLAHGLGTTQYGPVPKYPPTPYYDPNLPAQTFNPSAGKKLLKSHGWKLVNGVMTRGTQKLNLTFLYASGSNWVTHSAELMKSDWAQEGINVTLSSQPFNQVIALVGQQSANKWEIGWWGGGWCYEPDYFPSGGGLFASGAAANSQGYNNSTMNSLIQATYAPVSSSQTIKAMYAYQAFAAKNLPVLFLPNTTGYNATQKWLHGVNTAYNAVQAYESYNHWTTSGT